MLMENASGDFGFWHGRGGLRLGVMRGGASQVGLREGSESKIFPRGRNCAGALYIPTARAGPGARFPFC